MKRIYKKISIAAVIGIAVLSACERPSDMNKSTANVKHITQGQFEAEVTRSSEAVVADFYATWCGPCRLLSPMFEKLAAGYPGKIKFIKINVDESPGIAQNFQVQSIPTLIFFRDGKVAERITGLPTEADLKAKLDAFAAGK